VAGGEVAVGAHQEPVRWDLVRTGCVALVMIYHATLLSTYLHPSLVR
jgi:hypothetical protein